MNYNNLEKFLSERRLFLYKNHCKNNNNKAILLYKANIRLSKAFYPLLSMLEISLRNAINEEIINHFSDHDWLINEKVGFMARLNDRGFMLKSVNDAENKIRNNGKPITNDRIVAELSFGVWTSFYLSRTFGILHRKPINAFANLPAGATRNTVSQGLDEVRKFRNRVYHNETICFNNSIFDLTNVETIYDKIKNILGWFDPIYIKWITDIDEVPYELERIKYCANNKNAIKFYYNINKIRIKRAANKITKSHLLFKQTTT